MSIVLGVDLGGTKTAAGVVDARGNVLARAEVPTPASEGPEAVVETVSALARRLIDDHPEVGAAGIGSAGIIDASTRTVLSATDAIQCWAGTRLGFELEQALSIPVTTLNDVHAHAMGEAWVGAGRAAANMVLVAAGTGIGGAQVIDGVVVRGAHGAAGHFGHMSSALAGGHVCSCGGSGHVEAIASGPAILATFLRGGGAASTESSREVFELAQGGDSLALTAVALGANALGVLIGGLQNALDPHLVVVTGGLSLAGEVWWGPLRAAVAKESIPLLRDCVIVSAELGANAAIIGAAKAALVSMEEAI